jgi:hypothetical protein
VRALVKPQSDSLPGPLLACNYNFLSAAAAIFQILYAAFEIYQARGSQLQRFGYAAYSLTVIPYILMSFTNLVANACAPQYPSMFLVLYGGAEEHEPVGGDPRTGTGERELEQQNQSALAKRENQPRLEIEEIVVGLGAADMVQSDGVVKWQKDVEAKLSGAVGEYFMVSSRIVVK